MRLGLKELTDCLKERADSIDELPVQGNPFTWLARLFLLAANMNDQNVRDMINGLLPDQYGKFRNTDGYDYLYSDGGIPTEIKDIAHEIGEDIRSQLLHNEMAKALAAPGYEEADDLIRGLLDKKEGDAYTESKAIDMVIESLDRDLPDNSQFDEDAGIDVLHASRAVGITPCGE